MSELKEWLPFLIPLVLVQLILLVIAIVHILKHDQYKRGSRAIWLAVVIIGTEFIGPVLYFVLGKSDEE